MASLLKAPPASWGADGVFEPGDLGTEFDIFWYEIPGRAPPNRQLRVALRGVAYHIMGATARTPSAFADSMVPGGATLAECSFFDASTSPTGRACMLQVLPVQRIGAGTVAGCASYITAETSPGVGQDDNNSPWTEAQIELLARFYAFLVRNPRGWSKVDVRYQLASDPYASTAGSGGFGFHTFWGDLSTQLGGTSPWTLGGRSCPGYVRRGYVPTTPHYTLSLSADLPGNVRALYNRIGSKLAAPTPPKENTVSTYKSAATGDVYIAVVHPTAGYCLAHVDQGQWRNVLLAAGEEKTIPQATIDACPKITAQQYRDLLAAMAKSTPPTDISTLATHEDIENIGSTIVVPPPTPVPFDVVLDGAVDLSAESAHLEGRATPVELA